MARRVIEQHVSPLPRDTSWTEVSFGGTPPRTVRWAGQVDPATGQLSRFTIDYGSGRQVSVDPRGLASGSDVVIERSFGGGGFDAVRFLRDLGDLAGMAAVEVGAGQARRDLNQLSGNAALLADELVPPAPSGAKPSVRCPPSASPRPCM